MEEAVSDNTPFKTNRGAWIIHYKRGKERSMNFSLPLYLSRNLKYSHIDLIYKKLITFYFINLNYRVCRFA